MFAIVFVILLIIVAIEIARAYAKQQDREYIEKYHLIPPSAILTLLHRVAEVDLTAPEDQNVDASIPCILFVGPLILSYHTWRNTYDTDPVTGEPVQKAHLIVGRRPPFAKWSCTFRNDHIESVHFYTNLFDSHHVNVSRLSAEDAAAFKELRCYVAWVLQRHKPF